MCHFIKKLYLNHNTQNTAEQNAFWARKRALIAPRLRNPLGYPWFWRPQELPFQNQRAIGGRTTTAANILLTLVWMRSLRRGVTHRDRTRALSELSYSGRSHTGGKGAAWFQSLSIPAFPFLRKVTNRLTCKSYFLLISRLLHTKNWLDTWRQNAKTGHFSISSCFVNFKNSEKSHVTLHIYTFCSIT